MPSIQHITVRVSKGQCAVPEGLIRRRGHLHARGCKFFGARVNHLRPQVRLGLVFLGFALTFYLISHRIN